MAATYDPTLPSDTDYVRFLIGDVDVSSPRAQDEEIAAVLASQTTTGEARRYYAAAEVLSSLLVRWSSAGQGLIEKEVDDLRIRWGTDASSIQARITELRRRGAQLSTPRPRFFRAI